jgi:hypothetical protein
LEFKNNANYQEKEIFQMANKDKKAAAGGPKPDEQPVLPGDDSENDPLSIMW